MKAIGRILPYVLLATAFAKNVHATSAANVKFSRDINKIARFNITKLKLVSELPLLHSNIEDLWSILDDTFKNKPVQGGT